MEWAKRQQPGNAASKLVLILLADGAEGGALECPCREESLATEAGLTRPELNQALDQLEEAGLISAISWVGEGCLAAPKLHLLIPDKWWTPTTGRPRGRRALGDVPTAVYRFYDDSGALLYVGISDKPEVRFGQHERTKPWWLNVRTREVVWYDSKPAAEAEEERAIYAESPVYNIRDAADHRDEASERSAARKRRRRYVVANNRFQAFTKLVESVRADVFEGEYRTGLLPALDVLVKRYKAGAPEVQRALEVLHQLGVLELVDDGKYLRYSDWQSW